MSRSKISNSFLLTDKFVRTSVEFNSRVVIHNRKRTDWIGEGKTFFEAVYSSQKKRIFNALKNSSSDSVIKFKDVLEKIIDGK